MLGAYATLSFWTPFERGLREWHYCELPHPRMEPSTSRVWKVEVLKQFCESVKVAMNGAIPLQIVSRAVKARGSRSVRRAGQGKLPADFRLGACNSNSKVAPLSVCQCPNQSFSRAQAQAQAQAQAHDHSRIQRQDRSSPSIYPPLATDSLKSPIHPTSLRCSLIFLIAPLVSFHARTSSLRSSGWTKCDRGSRERVSGYKDSGILG